MRPSPKACSTCSFGGIKQQVRQAAPQASFFADPFDSNNPMPPPAAARVAGSGPAFCVRGCDGKYFPVTARGTATPAQMCQAFCPASPTKVYYGSNIDYASSANGERYATSENAFAYRKALRADCTCNGRDPGGLAPFDISLDGSLRPGDVLATTSGLVAYSGIRVGNDQAAEFTPVASFPGLTAEVRARLGEIKVAPVSAEIATEGPLPEVREPSDNGERAEDAGAAQGKARGVELAQVVIPGRCAASNPEFSRFRVRR